MPRTSESTVTFARPFTLASFEGENPAGTYRIVVDEEEILGLSFLAFRRVATMIHLPALGTGTGSMQMLAVDPADLEAALARDTASASAGS